MSGCPDKRDAISYLRVIQNLEKIIKIICNENQCGKTEATILLEEMEFVMMRVLRVRATYKDELLRIQGLLKVIEAAIGLLTEIWVMEVEPPTESQPTNMAPIVFTQSLTPPSPVSEKQPASQTTNSPAEIPFQPENGQPQRPNGTPTMRENPIASELFSNQTLMHSVILCDEQKRKLVAANQGDQIPNSQQQRPLKQYNDDHSNTRTRNSKDSNDCENRADDPRWAFSRCCCNIMRTEVSKTLRNWRYRRKISWKITFI